MFREWCKHHSEPVIILPANPHGLDLGDEKDALNTLLASNGWKVLRARLDTIRDNALRDNLSAHDVERLGENRGKVDTVEALALWPQRRLDEIEALEKKGK